MTPEAVRILVLVTTRAAPDGVTVHLYLAGEVYGPDSDPPMPAALAATFLREGWGERCDGAEDASRVHAPAPTREAPAGPDPDAECLWCGAAFARRATGGTAQRFCSGRCRQAFHTAARRYVAREIDEGRLDIPALRKVQEQHARSS